MRKQLRPILENELYEFSNVIPEYKSPYATLGEMLLFEGNVFLEESVMDVPLSKIKKVISDLKGAKTPEATGKVLDTASKVVPKIPENKIKTTLIKKMIEDEELNTNKAEIENASKEVEYKITKIMGAVNIGLGALSLAPLTIFLLAIIAIRAKSRGLTFSESVDNLNKEIEKGFIKDKSKMSAILKRSGLSVILYFIAGLVPLIPVIGAALGGTLVLVSGVLGLVSLVQFYVQAKRAMLTKRG